MITEKERLGKCTFLLILFVLLSSCATYNYREDSQKLGLLSVGMTKAEALKIMGHTPDRFSAKGDTEYLIYKQGFQEYYIRLIQGKVESYGKVGDFDTAKDPTLNLNIDKKE